jgi:hypothetical protein
MYNATLTPSPIDSIVRVGGGAQEAARRDPAKFDWTGAAGAAISPGACRRGLETTAALDK